MVELSFPPNVSQVTCVTYVSRVRPYAPVPSFPSLAAFVSKGTNAALFSKACFPSHPHPPWREARGLEKRSPPLSLTIFQTSPTGKAYFSGGGYAHRVWVYTL